MQLQGCTCLGMRVRDWLGDTIGEALLSIDVLPTHPEPESALLSYVLLSKIFCVCRP